jgi:hypothetical protein
MECLSQFVFVLVDHSLDAAKVLWSDTTVDGEHDRGLQPKLAFAVGRSNMNMRRLLPLIRIEVKTERTDAKNCRHSKNTTWVGNAEGGILKILFGRPGPEQPRYDDSSTIQIRHAAPSGSPAIIGAARGGEIVPFFDTAGYPMSGGTASNYFVHSLLRARDWQHRPQLDDVCQWWRGGGRGLLALVGMGGAGKTAIAERFLRLLPAGLPPDPDVPKDGSLPTPHAVFVFSFYDAPNPEAFFETLQMWLERAPRVQTVLSLGQMFFLLQQTSGLMVLDGLEKVQEDGVRGLLGRLTSPKLREFLDRIAAAYFSELSVLVTSRFPLADLRDARPQFFRLLPIDEIELPAGIRLLRSPRWGLATTREKTACPADRPGNLTGGSGTRMMAGMCYDVFLSHNSSDKPAVAQPPDKC